MDVHDLEVACGQRFASRVTEADGGCLVWTGALCRGYGHTKIAGKMVKAHRVSFVAVNGPIPCGMVLDHRCGNKRCVHPGHLEAVTSHENTLRASGRVDGGCSKCGQPFSSSHKSTSHAGGRRLRCLPCERSRLRKYRISVRTDGAQ